MSNLIINWRFWAWHFQVVRWGDWRSYIHHGYSLVTFTRNNWHHGLGSVRYPAALGGKQNPDWKRIEFYQGKRYAAALGLAIAGLVWWAL